MKKGFIYFSALALLACGGEDQSTTEMNADGTSSVVENTNPDLNATEPEHLNGDDHGNENMPADATSIEYVVDKHNFGTVFYPSENMYSFKFKNTGKFPLVISEATASCGCTIPNKPEEPIAPGAMGELDVIFRPKEGQIGQTVTKKITVTANTYPEETYLEITASVINGM